MARLHSLKFPCFFAIAASSLVCEVASAQSSLTLYGLISTGIVYANNQKGTDRQGHSTWQFMSGPQQTPRWGLKGAEDLGGGLRAIFTLENGFNVGNGTLSQGGREFGRQAYLGLASNELGTLTFGRQYDEMATLCMFESACQFAAYGTHIGDNDNVFDTFRVNNSVQYKSVEYLGLQFEALYAFSNKAGGFSDNNAYSAGTQYHNGPLSIGAAYVQINSPNDPSNSGGAVSGDYGFTSPFISNPTTSSRTSKQRIFGAGGAYKLGPVNLSLLYTNVRFQYLDTSRLTLQSAEVSLTDLVRADFLLGAAYIFTTGKYNPQANNPKWHQVNIGADYFLSKKTDLFLVSIYQRAAGDAQFAEIYTLSPSTTKTQISVVAGLRHKW
ncbi:gram-negative porin family protein [Burkholderia cenocepacia]|uniref:Gram-negative porin family protein n=1 Tax=Burkholderia cenocepacia TaxID=95486 RepID=A0AAN0RS23_9BURK|nr:gram-negative porin family protein [Burkholderia cenocepacia]